MSYEAGLVNSLVRLVELELGGTERTCDDRVTACILALRALAEVTPFEVRIYLPSQSAHRHKASVVDRFHDQELAALCLVALDDIVTQYGTEGHEHPSPVEVQDEFTWAAIGSIIYECGQLAEGCVREFDSPANKGYKPLYIGMTCGLRILAEAFPVIARTALHREPWVRCREIVARYFPEKLKRVRRYSPEEKDRLAAAAIAEVDRIVEILTQEPGPS